MTLKTARELLRERIDEWLSVPGVVGAAVGEVNGKTCIRVLTARKDMALAQKIPSQVGGFPVVIVEVGEIRALDGGNALPGVRGKV